jgi:hypothetical protein
MKFIHSCPIQNRTQTSIEPFRYLLLKIMRRLVLGVAYLVVPVRNAKTPLARVWP